MIRIMMTMCASALIFVSIHAPAATYYLTETDDGGTVYIIDTDTGTFTTYDLSPQENPGAIAISGDRVVISNYPDDGSWEYDLGLTPSGNSWPGDGLWSQMLDGTTDGINNYAASWSTHGVVEMDLNFENGVVLFNPGFSVIGITYDPTNDSLWLVNDDNNSVYNYTKGGVLLDSFDAGLDGRNCCLAYDPDTDSLWMSENAGSNIYNFAKDGTLMDTVTIAGLVADNTWGAEISGADGPVIIDTDTETIPVPAIDARGLALLVLLLGSIGYVALRRSS